MQDFGFSRNLMQGNAFSLQGYLISSISSANAGASANLQGLLPRSRYCLKMQNPGTNLTVSQTKFSKRAKMLYLPRITFHKKPQINDSRFTAHGRFAVIMLTCCSFLLQALSCSEKELATVERIAWRCWLAANHGSTTRTQAKQTLRFIPAAACACSIMLRCHTHGCFFVQFLQHVHRKQNAVFHFDAVEPNKRIRFLFRDFQSSESGLGAVSYSNGCRCSIAAAVCVALAPNSRTWSAADKKQVLQHKTVNRVLDVVGMFVQERGWQECFCRTHARRLLFGWHCLSIPRQTRAILLASGRDEQETPSARV